MASVKADDAILALIRQTVQEPVLAFKHPESRLFLRQFAGSWWFVYAECEGDKFAVRSFGWLRRPEEYADGGGE